MIVYYGVFNDIIIIDMSYQYYIELNKSKDEWNWYDASRHSSVYGTNWRDYLRDYFLEQFDNFVSLAPKQAKQAISKFLDGIYKNNAIFYIRQEEKLGKELSSKFFELCKVLENITGHELYFKNYKIFLTTFPRSPYNSEKGWFWFNIYRDEGIADVFLHEVLHMQFHKYWRENQESLVSKLPDKNFHFLKESLTVVLDDDLKPLLKEADRGYPAHQEFRQILHENWREYHDFDKLVTFGIQKLPRFI